MYDIIQVRRKLWPACLPDVNQHYLRFLFTFRISKTILNPLHCYFISSRETTYVAGWGITKTKFIHGSKIQVKAVFVIW